MTSELVIVGAGPAGMSAAIRAAQSGVQVTLLDEALLPGGQIYRQPPGAFRVRDPHALGADYAKGQALIGRLARHHPLIEHRPDTQVWGVFPPDGAEQPQRGPDAPAAELALLGDGRVSRLAARALIVAPGASERAVPFPGWTLPGVFTAGGVQILLKSQRVRPGERFLVAGTGPLLLVLANQLAKAGARVQAVLELSSLAATVRRQWPRLLSEPGLLLQGLGLHLGLRRAGIPYLERHTVVAARGDDQVREAVWMRVDADWNPLPGSERTVAVDAIAVGFGFVPNTELTRQAGARHRYDAARGGWVPETDEHLATSLPGIFAAGDGAGVRGSRTAELQGQLAAVGALRYLGRLSAAQAETEGALLRRRLRRLERFASAMAEMSLPRPGLARLAQPDTIVCRCEDVTAREIADCIGQGYHRLDSVKRITRAGMGFCQGRTCAPHIAALIAEKEAGAPEAAGWLRPRPPLRPVPLDAFASAEDEPAPRPPAGAAGR